MKNYNTKKYFNMVELVLAMTIIAIGFVGMMTIFPVGIKNSADAKERFYAKLASDHIMAYIRASIRWQGIEEAIKDDEIGIIPHIANSDKNNEGWSPKYIYTLFGGRTDDDYIDQFKDNIFSGFEEVAQYGREGDWDEIDIPGIDKSDNRFVRLFKKTAPSDGEKYNDTYKCAYRIQFITIYENTEVVNFDAICMAGTGIWSGISTRGMLNGRLDCVVTWPAKELPEKRKEDHYSIISQLTVPTDNTRILPYKPYY